MNHRDALRLSWSDRGPRCTVNGRLLTANQLGLGRDHVLAFHPTCDRRRGTIIRLAVEFCLTQQPLSLVRLGT
jgi:hypothetical protein